jgi:UDP-glucose 4-epimerase
MRILVTGGAGYIGSHTVVALTAAGHEAVIVDDFSNSHPVVGERLEQITGRSVPIIELDLCDRDGLDQVFAENGIDAVIHLAGLKAPGESVREPLKYYDTNLGSTFALVGAMQRHGVHTLLFSSSATVYGPDAPLPLQEDFEPLSPVNPYGQTKLMIERMLTDLAASNPAWRVGLLRYFNPVGAHPSGLIGEDPRDIPNNLMPFLAQVAGGRRDRLRIFGSDYPTDDGTAERDYLHVDDLAEAHVAALNALQGRDIRCRAWNLGTGQPTSVLTMLRAFEAAVEHDLPHEFVERRAGDVAVSWCDPSRAEAELGWRASRGIEQMCADTWAWQSRNPLGYGG